MTNYFKNHNPKPDHRTDSLPRLRERWGEWSLSGAEVSLSNVSAVHSSFHHSSFSWGVSAVYELTINSLKSNNPTPTLPFPKGEGEELARLEGAFGFFILTPDFSRVKKGDTHQSPTVSTVYGDAADAIIPTPPLPFPKGEGEEFAHLERIFGNFMLAPDFSRVKKDDSHQSPTVSTVYGDAENGALRLRSATGEAMNGKRNKIVIKPNNHNPKPDHRTDSLPRLRERWGEWSLSGVEVPAVHSTFINHHFHWVCRLFTK
jgi:hypothetical protein